MELGPRWVRVLQLGHAQAAGRALWFTYDGASLYSLRGVHADRDGLLVVDVERVVG